MCVFKYVEVMQNTKLMTASVFHGNLSPCKFCAYTDGLLMVIKLQLGKCKHTEASLPFLWQHAFPLVAAQFNSPYGIRTENGCCTHIGSLHWKKALVMWTQPIRWFSRAVCGRQRLYLGNCIVLYCTYCVWILYFLLIGLLGHLH